jgi:hypothetical protein
MRKRYFKASCCVPTCRLIEAYLNHPRHFHVSRSNDHIFITWARLHMWQCTDSTGCSPLATW